MTGKLGLGQLIDAWGPASKPLSVKPHYLFEALILVVTISCLS